MIHPFTLACALLAVGSGAWLYQSKHASQMLDRDINRTMRTVDEVRGRTGMLRAEYALLNDPARLQELADQVLTLKTTQPPQFAKLADLGTRLPPIGSFKPAEPEPQPIATPAPVVAASPTATAERVASYQQVSSPPPPPPVAHARPVTRVSAIVATPLPPPPPATAQPAPRPARPAAPSLVERAPLPEPARPRAVAAAPTPPAAVYRPAYAPPTYAPPAYAQQPATAAEAIARIARGGPVDPSVPVVASALGMARSMTPAAPIGAANAAAYDPRTGLRN